MGDFDLVSAPPHRTRSRSKPGDSYAASGYLEKDEPYYGVNLHLDGQAVFPISQIPVEGEPDEIYARYITGGQNGDVGKSPKHWSELRSVAMILT